jgi:hypothetical protein
MRYRRNNRAVNPTGLMLSQVGDTAEAQVAINVGTVCDGLSPVLWWAGH